MSCATMYCVSAAEAATTWRMASQAELRRRVASAGAWVGVAWWLTARTSACGSRQPRVCQHVALSTAASCADSSNVGGMVQPFTGGQAKQQDLHMMHFNTTAVERSQHVACVMSSSALPAPS